MKAKQLSQYISALKDERLLVSSLCSSEQATYTVESIEQDSRCVHDRAIFVALPGVHVDGATFIGKAIESGCKMIVTERTPTEPLPSEVAWLTVSDATKAIAVLASLYYDYPERSLTIVGITGTNGKTTTATLCYQLWQTLGIKSALFSTVCIRIGEKSQPATHTTPDALQLRRVMRDMVDEGCEYLFMEVSSHSLVQQRVYGLNFALALFTNLTRDHLDYHGTYDAYIAAKKMLFDQLSSDAFAVVNRDDRNALVMVQNCQAQIRTYAMKNHADFHSKLLEQYIDGSTIEIEQHEIAIRLLGRYNASNITAVYAVARLLLPHIDVERLFVGISSLEHVNGRFDVLSSPRGYHVVVDYAHTPDALKNLLGTVSELNARRVIVVVGAGGDRDKGKRPEMARVAYNLCDHLILTSDNPRSEAPQDIIDDMIEGIPQTERAAVSKIVQRAEAIRQACQMAERGDLIVIAGKGHETYQEIKGVRHHFDDKEEARKIFATEETL